MSSDTSDVSAKLAIPRHLTARGLAIAEAFDYSYQYQR